MSDREISLKLAAQLELVRAEVLALQANRKARKSIVANVARLEELTS